MSFTLDTFAAAVATISAIASFAVCRWRIADLERRVVKLEESDRSHAERVVVIETELPAIKDILSRIAAKLNVN